MSAASTWVIFDIWYGNGATDVAYSQRGGVIADPAAQSTTFQFRFYSAGSGDGFDDYFIDELEIGCEP